MSKKAKNSDQLFAELFVSTFKNLNDSTLKTIYFYENQYKIYDKLICSHMDSEPMKIFKKAHKKWEEELEQLKRSYNKAWENYIDECNEWVEIQKLVKMP